MLLTTRQAAEILGTNPKHISVLVRTGQLEAVNQTPGRRVAYQFDQKALKSYKAAQAELAAKKAADEKAKREAKADTKRARRAPDGPAEVTNGKTHYPGLLTVEHYAAIMARFDAIDAQLKQLSSAWGLSDENAMAASRT